MTIDMARERIVGVVPVRSFRDGKTRLRHVLGSEARASLLLATANGVVGAARDSDRVATVLVVSPDAEVLAWAKRLGPGVTALAQPAATPGLNGAISAGREWAIAEGATAVLSVFADLPFIAGGDIRALVARSEPVVLGPDRRGAGTNALLLRLAGNGASFQFAFGEGSLRRHLAEAGRLGLDAGIVRAAGLAFDLDTPADWADFVAARQDWAVEAEPSPLRCGAGVA